MSTKRAARTLNSTPPPSRGAAAQPKPRAYPTGSRRDGEGAASEALQLLDAAQVGAAFGLRPKYVLTLARDRGMPHIRLGRYVRFREASVKQWLDEHEVSF